MNRSWIVPLAIALVIPFSLAGAQEPLTFRIPKPPNYYAPKSIASNDQVAITWSNSGAARLFLSWIDTGGKEFFSIDENRKAPSVPAAGEFAYATKVGQAFFCKLENGGRTFCFMVPDGSFEHPDEKKFEETQKMDVSVSLGRNDPLFIFDLANGEGRFTCIDGMRTGYGTVWKKEFQKDGDREIDFYVQVVEGRGYKVLRNLKNRHTVRLGHNNRSEEASAGVEGWKPIQGSWIDPK